MFSLFKRKDLTGCNHIFSIVDEMSEHNYHYWYEEHFVNCINIIYDQSYLYQKCKKCDKVEYKRIKLNYAPFKDFVGGIHKTSTVYEYKCKG